MPCLVGSNCYAQGRRPRCHLLQLSALLHLLCTFSVCKECVRSAKQHLASVMPLMLLGYEPKKIASDALWEAHGFASVVERAITRPTCGKCIYVHEHG